MDYKANSCIVCGYENLKLISHKLSEENVFYTYRCVACGEIFSTETEYIKKQERIKQEQEKILQQQTKQNINLSATEIYKKCRDFVVEIEADFNDTLSQGTGIILGNGYILSNAHVVLDKNKKNVADSIICKFSDKLSLEFDLLYADINKDLAILYSEELDKDGAIFDEDAVETGEKVYAIGNSKGQGICILDGIVSDKNRLCNKESFIMYSAPTVTGNSGGPLFNAKGKIIGVVTLGRKDATAMNYAIPVETIKIFITDANDKEELDIDLLFD